VLVVAIWIAVLVTAPYGLVPTPTDGPLSLMHPPEGYWAQAEIPPAFPLVVSTLGATAVIAAIEALDRIRRRLMSPSVANLTKTRTREKNEPRVVGTRGSEKCGWLRGRDSNP
jgi:hypothetical protein